MIVLTTEEGGHGNNASGSVSFRGITITPSVDESGLAVTQSIDLGGGLWGRAVLNDGVGLARAAPANLLCPAPTAGGFELTEACPASVDPRAYQHYASWCAEPCKHGRKLQDRTGKYIVRGGAIRKVRARSLRKVRKGDLVMVEIPEPMSVGDGLDYVEIVNNAREAVVLSGIAITMVDGSYPTGESIVREPPECIADAGERIVLADADWAGSQGAKLDAGVVCLAASTGSFDFDRPLEIRAGPVLEAPKAPILARSVARMPEREFMRDAEIPRRAWQVDARGRACLSAPSPGRENQPCR
ncbi:MAG: hypothetical protein IPK13_12295 [Deltaproteobacteria bacterium]|nr:hypothetical protein [Deltaproteobacteria bacterium]